MVNIYNAIEDLDKRLRSLSNAIVKDVDDFDKRLCKLEAKSQPSQPSQAYREVPLDEYRQLCEDAEYGRECRELKACKCAEDGMTVTQHISKYNEMEADAELGRLVKAMPYGKVLRHYADGRQWSYEDGTDPFSENLGEGNTPIEALKDGGLKA
jgi:hypothetical protein